MHKFDEQGNIVVELSDKTKVTLREPRGKDIELMEQQNHNGTGIITASYMLVSSLSAGALSLDDVRELRAQDAVRLTEAVNAFPVFLQLAAKQADSISVPG